MSWFYRNKKILLSAIAVSLIAGGIFVLGAPDAKAWELVSFATGTIYKFVGDLLSLVQRFFGFLLELASKLLEAVFEISKFSDIPVVNAGWQITRGLANMFFALILLIMSISTILQSERFGIKKLLPKLVIAALLINFSLLFAGIIIDFSQVLTSYFINAAKGTSGISTQIMNGLNIGKSLQGVPNSKAVPLEYCPLKCGSGQVCEVNSGGIPGSPQDAFRCVPAPEPNTSTEAQVQKGDEGTLQIVIGYAFSSIITAIATFVILAAAIFMIIRIVVIWLLLIFAPLAWVSMIVAGGGGSAGSLWGKWWSTFFKWVFFAPIYAFFLYLAILAVGSGSFGQAFAPAAGTTVTKGMFNSLGSSVMLVLQYITIIIILLGGLMAAQQMGIAGAGAVMKIGKSAVKGISKATGRAGSRWLAQGAKIPGMKQLGKLADKIPVLKKAMPAMRIAGAVKQRLASMTSPGVWKRAWVARRARADNRAFSQASGALQDLLTAKGFKQVLKGKAPKPFYETIERNKIIAARTDEINKGMQDEGERVSAFLDAKDPIEKEALIRSLGSTNSINVLFGETFKREMDAMPELKMKMAKTAAIETEQEELEKRFADQPKTPGYFLRKNELAVAKANVATPQETAAMNAIQQRNEISPENFQGLIGKEFGKEGDRIGNDVQAMMTSNGNFSFTGAYMWDPEKNKIRASSTEERLAAAVGKFKEWEPQDFWRKAHPDSLFKSQFYINHQGKVDMRVTDLNDNGKVYVQNMSGLHYNQVNRAQGRMISKILDNQQVMQQTLTGPVKDKFNQLAEEAKKAHNKRTKE